jgi:hypothetical protein
VHRLRRGGPALVRRERLPLTPRSSLEEKEVVVTAGSLSPSGLSCSLRARSCCRSRSSGRALPRATPTERTSGTSCRRRSASTLAYRCTGHRRSRRRSRCCPAPHPCMKVARRCASTRGTSSRWSSRCSAWHPGAGSVSRRPHPCRWPSRTRWGVTGSPQCSGSRSSCWSSRRRPPSERSWSPPPPLRAPRHRRTTAAIRG